MFANLPIHIIINLNALIYIKFVCQYDWLISFYFYNSTAKIENMYIQWEKS